MNKSLEKEPEENQSEVMRNGNRDQRQRKVRSKDEIQEPLLEEVKIRKKTIKIFTKLCEKLGEVSSVFYGIHLRY